MEPPDHGNPCLMKLLHTLRVSIAHSLQKEKLELRDMNFLPCWLTQIAMCREEMQRNVG